MRRLNDRQQYEERGVIGATDIERCATSLRRFQMQYEALRQFSARIFGLELASKTQLMADCSQLKMRNGCVFDLTKCASEVFVSVGVR
jgi:hypothetical protein